MSTKSILVNEPVLSDDAKKYVNKALDTAWISSSGGYVKEFEQRFAEYLGVKYATTVSNGTAALHVSLLALGIGPKDEVIVPAFTMGATWLAVLYTGAKPVFVDCESDTFNINPKLIAERITKKTKAIIPVHVYGHPCDMDPIIKIARKHKLFVIEDAAESHGAIYKNKKTGTFGNINCFSFYANKIITSGEGGMVVSNDKKIIHLATKYKDLYHSDKKRFIHDGVSYNYRMTNLQAAVGLGELKHINEYINKKIEMAKKYNLLLHGIPGIVIPNTKSKVKNVYWMYSILVDKNKFGIDRSQLRQELMDEGVETRDFFYPPNVQPVLKKYLTKNEEFPVTEKISKMGMYLPSGLALTDQQMRRVASVIKKIYLSHQKG